MNNVNAALETGQPPQAPKRDLFLIAGIPGTGKTWYGDKFASEFDFVHYDLEDYQTLNRFAANSRQFISDVVALKKNLVVTWGFLPDQIQTALVLQFRDAGFKLIWFDGNRPAALRAFLKRGTLVSNCSIFKCTGSKAREWSHGFDQRSSTHSMTMSDSRPPANCSQRSREHELLWHQIKIEREKMLQPPPT